MLVRMLCDGGSQRFQKLGTARFNTQTAARELLLRACRPAHVVDESGVPTVGPFQQCCQLFVWTCIAPGECRGLETSYSTETSFLRREGNAGKFTPARGWQAASPCVETPGVTEVWFEYSGVRWRSQAVKQPENSLAPQAVVAGDIGASDDLQLFQECGKVAIPMMPDRTIRFE